MKRLLVLEDGTVFEGEAFGADLYVTGELVFTTAMTGYQELITDQAFSGQILSFTFPVIGATGINRDDSESITPTCLASPRTICFTRCAVSTALMVSPYRSR